jgi:aconitate hydratase
VTLHLPDGVQMSIFDAAMMYRQEGVPLIILAGKEYGSGSSRDWAAKGTLLLGVKAVIAESFERIHRSNLIGMGVLPLQFKPGESVDKLGITGREVFTIANLKNDLQVHAELAVLAEREDGSQLTFMVDLRLETTLELTYYRNGGILQTVLRRLL